MQDHTLNGTPVAQLATAELEALLRDGFSINDPDGRTVAAAERAVYDRIEIELLIRRKGLRP